jgi:hypothetical protein
MIKIIACEDCGTKHVVNITLLDEMKEKENVFGFLGEKVQIIESDITYCKNCGKRLPI